MSVKPTPREIKSDQTRQALIDSAIDLFAKYGIKKVTIDEICEKCGLTKGAFYHNFPSKDHIVAFSINVRLDNYIKEHYITDENMSIGEKFTMLNLCAFEYFKQIGKEMTRASYEAQIRSQVELKVLGRTYVDRMSELIHQGMTHQCINTNLNMYTTYLFCISTFTGILMKWCTQDDTSNESVDWEIMITELFRIIFK